MRRSGIPYGYRIVRGKAAVYEPEAEKIRQLFNLYLEGLSIEKAKDGAGIDGCVRAANNILQREAYLGDDYYPRIIDDATFNAAAEERDRRVEKMGERKARAPKAAVPVKERFIVADLGVIPEKLTASQRVAFLYSVIVPSSDGTEMITASDRSKLHNLANR